MKRILCAVMIVMLLLLCACGSGGSKFTVKYVGTVNVMSPSPVISGEMGGKALKISLSKAFKGCTVAGIAFPDEENVTLSAVEDGMYLAYEGGLVVTLKDESGKTFEVTVKEGSVFDAEKNGDTVCLLPPK